VEKKANSSQRLRKPQVSARYFSIARSEPPAEPSGGGSSGIVIQIRMKEPDQKPRNKLFTRKNTEFWLSASD
jgi:hypothetical protein